MVDLKSYGKLLRIYKGSGVLCFDNGSELHCRFDFAQVSDGRLYALCRSAEVDSSAALMNKKAIRLEGELDDGKKLKFEHLMIVHSNLNYLQETTSFHLIVYGKHATISESTFPQDRVRFKFALANLTILGTEGFSIRHPDGETFEGRQIPLTLDGFEVIIRPTNGYEDVILELKATRGVDVTCEALVVAESIEKHDTILRVMEDLCALLTLARGCRVEWLYYDIISSGGDVLKSYHRSAITKRYGHLQLIPTNPPNDTLDFINKAYPNCNYSG